MNKNRLKAISTIGLITIIVFATKIEYFYILIVILILSVFISSKFKNRKLKINMKMLLFQMTTIFYLLRDSGLGFSEMLENYYENFNEVKILFALFMVIGVYYFVKLRGYVLLKIYFFVVSVITFQDIFYIEMNNISDFIDMLRLLDMFISPLFVDCWIVGSLIYILGINEKEWFKIYILLATLIFIKLRIMCC